MAEGVSYSYLARLQDEREARQRLRELPYSEKEHLSNPFHKTGKEGLRLQSEFARNRPKHEVEFFKREASVPAALPFQAGYYNITKIGAAHKIGLAKVIGRAEAIYNDHRAADIQRLEEAAKSAEAELARVRERTALK